MGSFFEPGFRVLVHRLLRRTPERSELYSSGSGIRGFIEMQKLKIQSV